MIVILLALVINMRQPVEMNDDLSKLYAVIEDAEPSICTPSDASEASYSDLNEKDEETSTEETKGSYLGEYELTAYIATGNPCADGVYPQVGYTVASNDPNLWHRWIRIEGYGDYYVHDTGGMASNVIDIFVGSYDEAIQFGRRTADVYIIGE
jgi:3D (Asp-Asp-Asp) domain-containing protein